MSEITAPKDEAPKAKTSPKDVFLHLLMIAMLYTSTISFIFLWISYIDRLFPDVLNYFYQNTLESALTATATLVVAFPVFLFASWLISRGEKQDPVKHELRVRQWLIYLTLFVSAIAMIVAVINLVHDFLYGELTFPFFLKIAVVLLTAGAAFGYYLWDVRRTADTSTKLPAIFAWTAGALVLLSVSFGFYLLGSPSHQRSLRFDARRVNDLQTIQYQILPYWQKKGNLPAKLSDLNDELSGFTAPVDPQTGAPYEYVPKDEYSFDLCAVFEADSEEYASRTTNARMYLQKPTEDSWIHKSGRVCFERVIDPEMYRTDKPIPVIVQ